VQRKGAQRFRDCRPQARQGEVQLRLDHVKTCSCEAFALHEGMYVSQCQTHSQGPHMSNLAIEQLTTVRSLVTREFWRSREMRPKVQVCQTTSASESAACHACIWQTSEEGGSAGSVDVGGQDCALADTVATTYRFVQVALP